jgi:hypothetical protein
MSIRTAQAQREREHCAALRIQAAWLHHLSRQRRLRASCRPAPRSSNRSRSLPQKPPEYRKASPAARRLTEQEMLQSTSCTARLPPLTRTPRTPRALSAEVRSSARDRRANQDPTSRAQTVSQDRTATNRDQTASRDQTATNRNRTTSRDRTAASRDRTPKLPSAQHITSRPKVPPRSDRVSRAADLMTSPRRSWG